LILGGLFAFGGKKLLYKLARQIVLFPWPEGSVSLDFLLKFCNALSRLPGCVYTGNFCDL